MRRGGGGGAGRGEMKSQPPSLLALSALLLCTLQQTAPAWSSASHRSRSASASSSTTPPSEVRDDVEALQNNITHTNYGNQSGESGSSSSSSSPVSSGFSVNTSTVTSGGSGRAPGWSSGEEASSHCAYRVFEGGIGGQLCFRDTLSGYECGRADCRTVVSLGSLVANILINGSVLLQWKYDEQGAKAQEPVAENAGGNSTRAGTVPPSDDLRHGGFELSCWWNGSYTQFECAAVQLGSSCRDFLLTELHENIPYRLCLRSLSHPDPASSADRRDCVEFTLPPSGMQDIVIAMTTVGGAICVMLVIICLLVAYITENIMSPATQHTYSYRTHTCH